MCGIKVYGIPVNSATVTFKIDVVDKQDFWVMATTMGDVKKSRKIEFSTCLDTSLSFAEHFYVHNMSVPLNEEINRYI